MRLHLASNGFGLMLLVGLLGWVWHLTNVPALDERMERCIWNLPNDDYCAEAAEELLAIGPPALKPVRKLMHQTSIPEVRERCRAVRNRIAAAMPGGEPVNGLKICLEASKQRLRPGEWLKLTAMFVNVSDADLGLCRDELDPFDFRWVGDRGAVCPINRSPRQMRCVYDYGSPTLRPGEGIEADIGVGLVQEGRNYKFTFDEYAFQVLEARPGANTLRLVWQYPSRLVDRWTGVARSNDVVIEVFPADRLD
jgi:hypothetical protein